MKSYNYFSIKNIESSDNQEAELKRQYKKLAVQFHPDRGGNEESFKAMANEYEKILKAIKVGAGLSEEEANEEVLKDERYQNAINMIIVLEGIEIELVGTWIWISGNTFPHKEVIKAAGFLWAKKKKMWFFRTNENKSKSRKNLSFEEIKNLHGSKRIDKNTIKRLN